MAQGSYQDSIQARSYWALIAKRVSYARDLRKNFKELLMRNKELLDKKDQENNHSVWHQIWIRKVNEVQNEVAIIKKDYDNEQEGMKRICPDYFARIRLGERVLKLTDKINKILNKPAVSSFIESTAIETLQVTETFYETVQKLITQIREKKYPKIGIFGPHGVGKTSVMQVLKHSPEVTKDFDFVIWVTVSNSWTIKKLQDQVRQCLSMKTTRYESDEKVAEKIFQVLLGKKYILFLDDIRKMVDLGDLGFPNASKENGCQVILTTMTRDICWHIGTGSDIKVEGFATDEAWDMFFSWTDETKCEFNKYYVANICGGIPRSLKILAGALRNKVEFTVSEALYSYQGSKMIEIIFKRLEVTQRACLVYCACYPEHHKVKKSRVINYIRANTGEYIPAEFLAKTHEEIEEIFNDLVKSSWLERCDGGTHVTMPVVVRDIVLAGKSELESSKVFSLLLEERSQHKIIPEAAFNNNNKLQFLDLSGTSVKSLPDSIADMKSLRALFLKDCYFLETLPEKLGEVKTLEFLQVSGAWMRHLPLWIFKLESLKFLKFGYRSIARWWSVPHHLGIGERECEGEREREIQPGFVSKLSHIEVFNVSNFMYNSRLSNGSLSTIAKELGSLTHLSSLQFVFRTIEDLENFINQSTSWKQNALQKFRFIVGEGKDFRIDVKSDKQCLKYIGGRGSGESILPNAVLDVLNKTNCFELESHGEIESLSQLGEEATREVRHCLIHGCANLTCVINEDGLCRVDQTIAETRNIRTFANLKELEIQFCTNIEAIFETCLENSLINLEELRIKSCPRLSHVFSPLIDVSYSNSLPRLKKLTLADLPKLVCISSRWNGAWLDSLEEVCIFDCPLFKNSPSRFSEKIMKNLKKIKGSRKWWEVLSWDHVDYELRLWYESLFVET